MTSEARYLFQKRLTRTVGALGLVLLYVFLLAPLIIVLIISFDTSPVLSFPPKGFTFDWYATLANNQAFMGGLVSSLIIASVVTIITTAAGLPASIALTRYKFPGRTALSALVMAPLLLPTVVLGLALLLVLAPLGLVGTYAGLIISHLAISIPYVVRTISMSLSTMDLAAEEASKVLGASPFATFMRVTLPLAAPGILAGAFFAFLISFDEAVISLFVVGSGAGTLPVEIFKYVLAQSDPQVAALSVLLVLFSVLLMLGVERALGLRKAVVV